MRLSVRLAYSSLLSLRTLSPLTFRPRPISRPLMSTASFQQSPPSRPFATVMSSVRHITDNLEKPDLDDRSYRVIELPNKLEALLVHDAQTDKASASLNVNVGNFCDEEDMPGMAHAVEHLLFMGTEKVRWQHSARYSRITNPRSIRSRMSTAPTSPPTLGTPMHTPPLRRRTTSSNVPRHTSRTMMSPMVRSTGRRRRRRMGHREGHYMVL